MMAATGLDHIQCRANCDLYVIMSDIEQGGPAHIDTESSGTLYLYPTITCCFIVSSNVRLGLTLGGKARGSAPRPTKYRRLNRRPVRRRPFRPPAKHNANILIPT